MYHNLMNKFHNFLLNHMYHFNMILHKTHNQLDKFHNFLVKHNHYFSTFLDMNHNHQNKNYNLHHYYMHCLNRIHLFILLLMYCFEAYLIPRSYFRAYLMGVMIHPLLFPDDHLRGIVFQFSRLVQVHSILKSNLLRPQIHLYRR